MWVNVIFNFVERDIGWIYIAFGISYVIGISLNIIFIVQKYRSLRKSDTLAAQEPKILENIN